MSGIHAIPAPGHTPGHIAVLISSGSSQLLQLADAVLRPLHLELPDWQAVFDLVPERAGETRRALLDRAAAEQMMVMAYHFPFPGIGEVRTKEKGKWQWEPIGGSARHSTS